MAKVIYYNPSTMGTCYDEGLELASRMVRSPVPVDRSGKSNILNISYDKIPDSRISVSFYDACMSRGVELWKRSMDKPITLFWSGGMDSTVALFSFLETKTQSQKLIIRFTKHAIEEYPWLYDKMCKWGDDVITLDQVSEYDLFRCFDDDTTMFVHGNNIDCLFGSSVIKRRPEALDEHWYSIDDWDIVWAISGDNLASKDLSANRDKLKRLKMMTFLDFHVLESPYEIKTVYDLYWWLNFSLKWHWLVYCYPTNYLNSPNFKSQNDFANGKDLQIWSIMNRDNKHKGTWLSYKYELKDFIYKFTKDADYRDNKEKVKSLVPLNNINAYPHIRTKLGDDKLRLVLDDGRYWYNKDEIPNEVLNSIKLNTRETTVDEEV